jgi:4-hydroxy-tetrahydrodipicolinate synthase
MSFQGAFTALITPFKNNEVDFAALEALVERQIDGGINGLVPCGTTGESATMSATERLAVIQKVVDVTAGRVPIIAGTGTNNTLETTQFTQQVSKIRGVDAALVVTPYYNKPGQRGIVAHFEFVAENGGLPVIVYNVPGRTVVGTSAETVATLARHPNIVGIKEASADMNLDTEIFQKVPRDFSLLSGDDFTTLQFVLMGGAGCISVVSNIAPRLVHDLVDAARKGDLVNARILHNRVHSLAKVLFSDANPVPTKTAAKLLGWCSDEARLPLYTGDEALVGRVSSALREAGLMQ